MYLETVESFLVQAEDLYKSNPLKTRYVMKYRHCDGKLVVKVTDDRTCLQYKTDQIADFKKLQKLNMKFFHLMATGVAPAEDAQMAEAQGAVGAGNSKGKGRRG
eukprot:jgi/Picsp_1/215/NSC_00214-R1_signal recognition particle 9 kda protein